MTLQTTLRLATFMLLAGCQSLADTNEGLAKNAEADLPALPFTAESFKAFADPADYKRFFELTPYQGKEAEKHTLSGMSVIQQEMPLTMQRELATYQLQGWTRIVGYLPDEISEILAMQSRQEWSAEGKLVGIAADPVFKKDWLSLAAFPKLKAIAASRFQGGDVNVDIRWFNPQWQSITLYGFKPNHLNDLCQFTALQDLYVGGSYPQQPVAFNNDCHASLVDISFKESRLDDLDIAGPASLVYLDMQQATIHKMRLQGKHLPNLAFIDLRAAQLPEDVSQIQFPDSLKQLSLIDQRSPSAMKLKLPANLSYLNLENAQLTDYQFITQAKNLESLNLSRSNFTQWALLKELPNLKHLSVQSTQLTDADLQHIAQLTNLQTFDPSYTQLTTAKPLQRLAHLRTLNLGGTKITDYANIPYFKTMQALSLPNKEQRKFDVSMLAEPIQKMVLASRYKKPYDPELEIVYQYDPTAQYDLNYGQLCGPAKPCDIAPWYLPKNAVSR